MQLPFKPDCASHAEQGEMGELMRGWVRILPAIALILALTFSVSELLKFAVRLSGVSLHGYASSLANIAGVLTTLAAFAYALFKSRNLDLRADDSHRYDEVLVQRDNVFVGGAATIPSVQTMVTADFLGRGDRRVSTRKELFDKWGVDELKLPLPGADLALNVTPTFQIIVRTDRAFDYDVIDLLLESLAADVDEAFDSKLYLLSLENGSWNIATVAGVVSAAIAGTALVFQIIDRDTKQSSSMNRTLAAICYHAAQNEDVDVVIKAQCDKELEVTHADAVAIITPDEEPTVPQLLGEDLVAALRQQGKILEPIRFDATIVRARGPYALAPDLTDTPIRIWDARAPREEYIPGARYQFEALLRYDATEAVTGAMVTSARPIGSTSLVH